MSGKRRVKKWTENVRSTIKTVFSKANPFDKNIDKNDVADTGTESIKLAYTSVKKGKNTIKTVDRTVKTTQRTIRTVGSAVKNTGTVVYKATDFTVKSAIKASKFVGNAAVHVVASLMNPIFIFFASIIIIFVIMAAFVVLK